MYLREQDNPAPFSNGTLNPRIGCNLLRLVNSCNQNILVMKGCIRDVSFRTTHGLIRLIIQEKLHSWRDKTLIYKMVHLRLFEWNHKKLTKSNFRHFICPKQRTTEKKKVEHIGIQHLLTVNFNAIYPPGGMVFYHDLINPVNLHSDKNKIIRVMSYTPLNFFWLFSF